MVSPPLSSVDEMKSPAPMPKPPEVDRAAAARAALLARAERATAKQQLTQREITPLELLTHAHAEPQSAVGRMRVPDFLRAIPGIGALKSERILERLQISPVKRLGGLGRRQFNALCDFLAAWQAEHSAGQGTLIVLAGPTAVGKGTVAGHIRAHHPEVHLSVSATTRSPRPGEQHGEHYFFVSDDEFDAMVANGELLEWATVHNSHRYGTPRGPVEEALRAGKNVLLEIDIQGARSVRSALPSAHLVFLLPPSWEELVRRLTGRGTETSVEQARRLETAKIELAAADEFDSQVVNHDVAEAAKNIVDLMNRSRSVRGAHVFSGHPRQENTHG